MTLTQLAQLHGRHLTSAPLTSASTPLLPVSPTCRAHFQNLQSFLDAYQLGLTVLVTQQDFYELAGAYLEQAAANNIKHTEIFFDVQSHVKRCDGVYGGF